MPTEVLMPKLGLTMTEGTILRWLIAEGQPVQIGQILFEIETEKAVTEMEAQTNGTVGQIIAPAGATIAIGKVIGYILLPGETTADIPATPTTPVASTTAPFTLASPPSFASPPASPTPDVKASPIARRLAKELNVELSLVNGTGPAGRIVEDDVRRAARSQSAITPSGDLQDQQAIPFRGVRRLIAERLTASLHDTAQLTLIREVDATELVTLRRQLNAGRAPEMHVTFNDFFIYIVARALRQHPAVNARLEGETIRQLATVNIGLAVDHERGLLVPVVREATDKTLDQICQERRRLLEAIQHNRLTPDELVGSTFTITNLGAFGVDAFTPILNSPECGILGVGRILAKPVVRGDPEAIVIRHMLTLSLSFDHRLVDGVPAARFLAALAEMIETPSF